MQRFLYGITFLSLSLGFSVAYLVCKSHCSQGKSLVPVSLVKGCVLRFWLNTGRGIGVIYLFDIFLPQSFKNKRTFSFRCWVRCIVLCLQFRLRLNQLHLKKKSPDGAIHHLNIYNLVCHLIKSHCDVHFMIASLKQIRKVT